MIAVTQGGRTSGSLDDEGAIGIGTMIVFIAMVIVAAVAAAVLINTAGTLQRKSGETGQETTQEVSGNVFVRDVVGTIDTDNTNNVTELRWYVSLAPGAEPVDLENLVIRWEHGSDLVDLKHVNQTSESDCQTGNSLTGETFCTEKILDVGDSNADVLSEGDRTILFVNVSESPDQTIGSRDSVDVLFIPEKGTPVDAGFKTPATFGEKSHISLK